ncbi:hypothetical protein H9Y05_07060 [Crocinitomicaceae bacterium CZZ-1]|uniref:DUF4190 domain-containing protein n=1 Tax=Taishania pollutisoli TaxID=2766479 RepID=A0A8J6PC81_9FLAO|nr:hypothetical protein [Taishania pollutisoli]MBC9812237.1 hypothetical protein [Taishania pollutisoli]MBX2950546.1 hypothetical protein [Crocinitomicaceae bacterium]NGF74625.1 hypothetical protein [Fluviicola sp. SGL-29]
MSENQNGTAVQGKGLGVTGFVLALVTLVLASWMAVMAAASIALGGSGWIMYLWLVLAIASVVLSVMGMVKLGKTGGKKGLAIAGMVIGIVSTVYSIILVLGLNAAAAISDQYGEELRKELNNIDWEQELNDELNNN